MSAEVVVSVRREGRPRFAEESGLGMIEVMISIFVLAVALMALASVALASLDSLRDTREREQATNAASAAIEDVRTRDFADIALESGTVDPDRLPDGAPVSVATTSCFGLESVPDGERLVVGGGDDPVPFERMAGDEDAFTVHTLVTYDDVDCGTDDRSPLKRITVIVSWATGDSAETLVQTTTVTDVGRGLPVPRFEIRPEQSSVRFSESYLNDPGEDPHRRCTEHTLRNLGAEDSYDWELVDSSEGGVVSYEPTHDAYDVDGWRITAYLEPDPDEIDREGEPPESTDHRFTDEAGFPRLVSDLRVESAETTLLTFCVEPTASVADLPAEVDVDVLVRSRFDERVEREVTLTVEVADATPDPVPGDPLYLFDHDDSGPHARIYEPGEMGPLADEDDSDELAGHLTEHDYLASQANWSTDIGDENLAGVRLLVGGTSAGSDPDIDDHTAAWHYQFGSTTTIERDLTLRLYVAPAEALQGSIGGDTIPMGLDVRIDELNPGENPTGGVLAETVIEYGHTTPQSASTGGWQLVEVPLDLGSTHEFGNNRYLRLRVSCVTPESVADADGDDELEPRDCNIAYDNVEFDSALYIQVR